MYANTSELDSLGREEISVFSASSKQSFSASGINRVLEKIGERIERWLIGALKDILVIGIAATMED